MRRNMILWLLCTLYSIWQYLTISLAHCPDCFLRVEAIAAGQAEAPFAYRIFAPMILQYLGNTPMTWLIWQGCCIGMFYALLWRWARYWQVNPSVVLLLASLAFGVMLPTFYFSAYSILEWDLWLCGWLYLLRLSQSEH